MLPRSVMDTSEFDAGVRPADDFFDFVNGKWLKEHPIPKEESRWGTFHVLRVQVEQQLKAILDDLTKDQAILKDPIAQKVRDFYLTAMDAERCNRGGIAPLADPFRKIDAIRDAATLADAMQYLHRNGVGALWVPISAQDEKDTDTMALYFYQGGLGLPDRDYYLNDDEKSREIRRMYLAYMKAMLGKINMDSAAAAAIMDTETRLARASDTRVELRDPERQYNKFSFSDVAKRTPSIHWERYFGELSIPVPKYFIVGQPKFMDEMDGLVGSVAPDTLKAYLRWQTANSLAPFLTEEMERLRFDFYNRNFIGATEMKPRWRRVLVVMNAVLEDAMGRLYIERHFSAHAKRRVNALVDHLIAAYRARIERLDWMSKETKEKAVKKLASVSRKLGYPDQWKDLTGLRVGTASYAENYRLAHAFEFDRQMKKIGGPVDRTEWCMYPQTVNACYLPPMNEILFPAAILQPPFFDQEADDAVNFGGIGSVIGHELTHGFDDQGSKYDARGNLADWWMPEDRARFEKKASRLAEQFDHYEPLPSMHVNGRLTLGENLADLGGLCIAYDGLSLALKGSAAPHRSDPSGDLTPAQRFFVSYAITECGQAREEQLRLQLQTDPHSPSRYRVNGPLSNMTEFYEAFGCKKGDVLWREPNDRVEIW